MSVKLVLPDEQFTKFDKNCQLESHLKTHQQVEQSELKHQCAECSHSFKKTCRQANFSGKGYQLNFMDISICSYRKEVIVNQFHLLWCR